MAKVKFVVCIEDKQDGLPGTGVQTLQRTLDLGTLHLEDKAIVPVLKGMKIQCGTGDVIQAWKKEHGVDGWLKCAEEKGSGKKSYGENHAKPEIQTEEE